MGLIKDLWEIGKDIFDLSDKLKKQNKERRQSLSGLLLHIGEVIKDAYEKLSVNTYPAGNCEQLELFGEELYNKTHDILGDEKARVLANKLKQAHEVKRLYADLNNGAVDKNDLVLLDESSGHFIASSKLLMV